MRRSQFICPDLCQRPGTTIVRCTLPMKRVFSHLLLPIVIGLLLRLFFLFRLPSAAGDTPLYEALGTNWLHHHVYGIPVNGALRPVDIRMPGYPAYLALIQAITGRSAEAARFWVMLGQVFLDVAACLVIAEIAARCSGRGETTSRPFMIALWLAALCPFTANYSAAPLTETFAIFTTALVFIFLIPMVNPEYPMGDLLKWGRFPRRAEYMKNAALAGVCTGFGTLFRPETPLILISSLPVVCWVAFRRNQLSKGLRASMLSVAACLFVLLPWTIRNAVTLHEFQTLTPRYSTMPGELVPTGFMSWERTWLYRFREVFLVSWKLNDDTIQIDDIPARAFDTPEERQHVAAILERYNNDSNLSAQEDQQFAEIAQARTARHPLRTYLWVPLQRTATLWFTPRVEQLPVSGSIFPLARMWDTDRQDMVVTIGLFFLNIFYVLLALWGAARLWSNSSDARAAVVLLVCFVLLRTAFLTTVETPEPRYVLVCFPALIALAACAFPRCNPASLPAAPDES
jgi:hypothetical protein